MQVFLGFKERKRSELIQSEITPTLETHPQFDFIYGPFKSVDESSKYVKAMTGLACGEG